MSSGMIFNDYTQLIWTRDALQNQLLFSQQEETELEVIWEDARVALEECAKQYRGVNAQLRCTAIQLESARLNKPTEVFRLEALHQGHIAEVEKWSKYHAVLKEQEATARKFLRHADTTALRQQSLDIKAIVIQTLNNARPIPKKEVERIVSQAELEHQFESFEESRKKFSKIYVTATKELQFFAERHNKVKEDLEVVVLNESGSRKLRKHLKKSEADFRWIEKMSMQLRNIQEQAYNMLFNIQNQRAAIVEQLLDRSLSSRKPGKVMFADEILPKAPININPEDLELVAKFPAEQPPSVIHAPKPVYRNEPIVLLPRGVAPNPYSATGL